MAYKKWLRSVWKNGEKRMKRSGLMVKECILLLIFFFFLISEGNSAVAVVQKQQRFHAFSAELKRHFGLFGWHGLDIETLDWEYHRESHGGRPLIFTTFGGGSGQVVLFLGAVHGDESPSAYLLFRFAQFLKENHQRYPDKTIIVAPLVNPDGFLSKPQRRTNGRGVDLNRNFPTPDWRGSKKDRYYSGPQASSENETKFQVALISRFRPTHIISIHSPLGCYDYDGPSSNFDAIVMWMKRVSKENGLPFRRYQVFPGSLGNYAGNQKKIHTLTLELPSSVPQKGAEYFDQFKGMFLDLLALNP
jgi:protein MpaA